MKNSTVQNRDFHKRRISGSHLGPPHHVSICQPLIDIMAAILPTRKPFFGLKALSCSIPGMGTAGNSIVKLLHDTCQDFSASTNGTRRNEQAVGGVSRKGGEGGELGEGSGRAIGAGVLLRKMSGEEHPPKSGEAWSRTGEEPPEPAGPPARGGARGPAVTAAAGAGGRCA
jgi:hypothetical protein